MTRRRRAFLFEVFHRDGSSSTAIFYALTAGEALHDEEKAA